MRIQFFSDLHFEFHDDGGAAFVERAYVPNVDVVVLAGDIAVLSGIGPALSLFSERYPHVVFVHGNHEFFGGTRAEVVDITERACARLANVHWLDASTVTLGGRRFLGGPLWFPESEDARRYRAHMNDFSQIRDYERWVYREHERCAAFFERETRAGDIVISHHLPTHASVRPEFKNHPLNCYFVGEIDEILRVTRPSFWIHGHTHGSVDLEVFSTRVLCNPFGYVGIEQNASFDPHWILELPGFD